ncbi:alpha/beta hydrolase [Nocardia sp. NPDC004068]|uniref:alpha/beta hydrolase n=1 Tax=Nocardia sp. NPDC004068 TaxID=3364303 RepID=UPI0036BEE7F7
MIRPLLMGLCLALFATVPATAAPASGDALTLRSDTTVDPRLHELVFTTPALDAPTFVRVLLPVGYSPARRYPVLLLLEGCCNLPPQARDWTDPGKGDAERIVGDAPLIVVMPDSGMGGFYSDWYNNGRGGNPRWESYHMGQLLPWIDEHYSTVPGRAGHAVAGLSMGGFGAMSYAARHPDRFVSAASFSGVVDSNIPEGSGATVDEWLSYLDKPVPGSLWGPRATQEIRWRAHNPWDLADNLRGTHLELYTGDGSPGPYNSEPDPPESDTVHPQSVSLHRRLTALGIAHEWHDYGGGAHSWPYWRRDLADHVPGLMATFAHPAPPPEPFTFTAAEPHFDIYGYEVTAHRDTLEFATLGGVSASGFTLTSTTSASVTTAARYTPAAAYRVTISNPHRTSTEVVPADRDGRLHISIPDDPASPGIDRPGVDTVVTITEQN